jgi:uncharacterized membrane-anchored protein
MTQSTALGGQLNLSREFPLGSAINKVPETTAIFWGIKIMSTTVGETIADFLAVDAGLGQTITRLIMATLLALALIVQFRKRAYTPWTYWLTVVLISVVGTQVTDMFTDLLGVSLYISTFVFLVALALVFQRWYKKEGTLSIHKVDSPKREAYYWTAILCTFALGTAAGDLATEAFGLGFQNGLWLFGAAISFTFVAWKKGANAVGTFWVAYVLTRPFGAALGDWLTQAHMDGGLELGTLRVSAVFLSLIILAVGLAQIRVQSRAGSSAT